MAAPELPGGAQGRADARDITSAARSFEDIFDTYTEVSKLYEENSPALKGETIRRHIGELQAKTRDWGRWMIHHLDATTALAVPAMQWTALGCFAAAWSTGFDGPITPTKTFLADYLRSCGVRAWLIENDCSAPHWLP